MFKDTNISVHRLEFVRICLEYNIAEIHTDISNRPEQQTLLSIMYVYETQDLLEKAAKTVWSRLGGADLEALRKAQQECKTVIGEEVTLGSFYSGCSVESHSWSLVEDLLKEHSGENINYRLKFIIERELAFQSYFCVTVHACMILFGLFCL